MRNAEPSPNWLRTSIRPPLPFTIPNTIASPSPAFFSPRFVVKNGSKTCCRVPSSIPKPVSRPSSSTSARSPQFVVTIAPPPPAPILQVRRPDLHRAARRHRLARVGRQIHEHLVHLAPIRLDHRQIGR